MKRYSLALLALFLIPIAASAADLPVSYTVDEKALKLAIAGTNVTFDLYTDSACSGPIAHTETVAIENVDIISKLKLGVPKGATVKPPKTDELHHTLVGVPGASTRYLKVSGTGITPVGGSCQAQGPAVVPVPLLQDSSGTILGPVQFNPSCGLVALIATASGAAFGALDFDGFSPCGGSLYFTSSDCTGTPEMYPSGNSLMVFGSGINGTLYVPPLSGGSPTTLNSFLNYGYAATCTAAGETFTAPHGCCCTAPSCPSNVQTVAPAAQTLTFNLPFTIVTP